MAGISRYARGVLALTAGFVLFCGGRFSAQLGDARPWRVNTALRLEETFTDVSREEADPYPESLLPGEVIDVNTADVYDLQRLPGVGEKRAQDIIDWRTEHGPFQTVDQLTEVPGIGPGILEGLREYASAGQEPAL